MCAPLAASRQVRPNLSQAVVVVVCCKGGAATGESRSTHTHTHTRSHSPDDGSVGKRRQLVGAHLRSTQPGWPPSSHASGALVPIGTGPTARRISQGTARWNWTPQEVCGREFWTSHNLEREDYEPGRSCTPVSSYTARREGVDGLQEGTSNARCRRPSTRRRFFVYSQVKGRVAAGSAVSVLADGQPDGALSLGLGLLMFSCGGRETPACRFDLRALLECPC
ncbi:hypothetical protein ASPZODRAFT_14698 [Penicilliopsis zonata CBS 506.65]|uniref:Uncharacterized protein n=1 Tax=Penicilliopsis zonata CBS 506.65 TaxID=1073090 RepID=A0A1L9SMT1_9EURO|nr:hypothetical protein ASPZODRAFT_14698 [Penicilliopsis zonata CBS 506.65]OJJ48569.1 hypothetical protein ASPZODRAFT_14698 [Penicilliopsis zonata CBS 506.65]